MGIGIWGLGQIPIQNIFKLIKSFLKYLYNFYFLIYEKDLAKLDTGYIHQDYDVYIEDITVSDKLKQVLLVADSEAYSIFSQENRYIFI